MGWDPSIELVRCNEGNFYHIMVDDMQYKTLEVLRDHRADYLLSRAARIYKVKKSGRHLGQRLSLKGPMAQAGSKAGAPNI